VAFRHHRNIKIRMLCHESYKRVSWQGKHSYFEAHLFLLPLGQTVMQSDRLSLLSKSLSFIKKTDVRLGVTVALL